MTTKTYFTVSFFNRHINKQNYRYWSDENPRHFRKGYTQYHMKVKIGVGILGNACIKPLFMQENQLDAVGNIILQEEVRR